MRRSRKSRLQVQMRRKPVSKAALTICSSMVRGRRSAPFLMCTSGRRVSLMILDGVAPASTTMAATLGMMASVVIAEEAEQGSWGAIRLIWMRLDWAGDSDQGRAPQTGMRVAADVTLHPLAIAPVATTGSATGRPSARAGAPNGRSRRAAATAAGRTPGRSNSSATAGDQALAGQAPQRRPRCARSAAWALTPASGPRPA